MTKNLIIVLALLLMKQTIFATNYYFSSVSGDNDRSSVIAQDSRTPWRSLDKLNEEFLKNTFKSGDKIYFKRGETFPGSIIVSGTVSVNSSGIFFGAYGTGDRPVISGLEALALTRIESTMKYESQTLPLTSINLVTLNNIPLAMARWPNSDAPNGGYIKAKNATAVIVSKKPVEGTVTYDIDDPDLPPIPPFTDAAVFVGRTRNWSIDRDDLLSHTTTGTNRTMTYNISNNEAENAESKYEVKPGFGFFLQGEEALLDKNTEWWYSPARKIIYWSGSSPIAGSVKAPNVANLITTNGKSYLTFDNLDLQGADLSIFEIDVLSLHITIQNCNISLSGKWGVHTLGDYTTITDTEIKHCLDEGVFAENKAPFLWMDHDIISNIGMLPGMGGTGVGHYAGIDIRGDNSTTQYCQTYLTGYSGIFTHAQADIGNILQYCIINSFDNVVNDGGGIYYIGGDGSGRKCLYNIVMGGGSAGYGTSSGNIQRHKAEGIYLDQETRGVEVKYNTVFDCYRGFFFNAGCNNIDVQWNTSFNNSFEQLFINVGGIDGSAPDPQMQNNTFKHNIWFSKNANTRTAEFARESNEATTFWPFSSIGDVDYNYYERPLSGDNNTIFRNGLISLADWQDLSGLDDNSEISPILLTNESDIRFEYNPTSDDITISLNRNGYISATGVKYVQDIKLKPYTSIILLDNPDEVLSAVADSYVRDGTYDDQNFGAKTTMNVKGGASVGFNRNSFLKFSLSTVPEVTSAKLRLYGDNIDGGSTTCSVFPVSDDSWTETGITWEISPAASGSVLSAATVNPNEKYYEFDVTSFVKAESQGDGIVSFKITDEAGVDKSVAFNTKENSANRPQLIIVKSAVIGPVADSYVRDNTYAGINYGLATTMGVKGPQVGYNKWSYLKFPLNSVANVLSAKLRVYGSNTESSSTTCSVLATTDGWSETGTNGITWNSKPASTGSVLSTATVTTTAKYYEFNVTSYVKNEFAGDKIASFVIKDLAGAYKNVDFNTKENSANPPQLVIDFNALSATYASRKNISSGIAIAPIGSESVTAATAQEKASVYPNPARKSFILTLPGNYPRKFSLQIMDELGRVWDLGQQRLRTGESFFSVDIAKLSLSPGAYYLMIHCEARSTEVIKLMLK